MQYEKFSTLWHMIRCIRIKNFIAQDADLRLNSRLSFYGCYPVAEMIWNKPWQYILNLNNGSAHSIKIILETSRSLKGSYALKIFELRLCYWIFTVLQLFGWKSVLDRSLESHRMFFTICAGHPVNNPLDIHYPCLGD